MHPECVIPAAEFMKSLQGVKTLAFRCPAAEFYGTCSSGRARQVFHQVSVWDLFSVVLEGIFGETFEGVFRAS